MAKFNPDKSYAIGVFETAKRKPSYFGGLGRSNGGEHE